MNDIRHHAKLGAIREARAAKTPAEYARLRKRSKYAAFFRVKFPDYSYRDLELRVGFPASLAYRRLRVTYRPSVLLTNRW